VWKSLIRKVEEEEECRESTIEPSWFEKAMHA